MVFSLFFIVVFFDIQVRFYHSKCRKPGANFTQNNSVLPVFLNLNIKGPSSLDVLFSRSLLILGSPYFHCTVPKFPVFQPPDMQVVAVRKWLRQSGHNLHIFRLIVGNSHSVELSGHIFYSFRLSGHNWNMYRLSGPNWHMFRLSRHNWHMFRLSGHNWHMRPCLNELQKEYCVRIKLLALDWQWVTLISWWQMNRLGHSSPVMHKVGGKTHTMLEKLKIMSGKSTLFCHLFVKYSHITCVDIWISLNKNNYTPILYTYSVKLVS